MKHERKEQLPSREAHIYREKIAKHCQELLDERLNFEQNKYKLLIEALKESEALKEREVKNK